MCIYIYIYICMCIYIYIYIYICIYTWADYGTTCDIWAHQGPEAAAACAAERDSMLTTPAEDMVAIFYPFGQFCEINISLLSLQKQPNTAPNLFQRGVEYVKYGGAAAARPRHRRLSEAYKRGRIKKQKIQ